MEMRPYLLGFVQDCDKAPWVSGLSLNITRLGTYGILWYYPSATHFLDRQKFLLVMLDLYKVLSKRTNFLPVQVGIRANRVDDLLILLEKYYVDLEACFQEITGCCEYFLEIALSSDARCEGISGGRVKDGSEYLQQLHRKAKQREELTRQVWRILQYFCDHLTPLFKNYKLEAKGGRMEAAFLVPQVYEEQIGLELQNACKGLELPVNCTGPWPPFHFSTFHLQPDVFLLREQLFWKEEEAKGE